MRWLRFILSHSIFVALCAVALCYQSYIVLHIQPGYLLYGFVFFATLCSYNFYWLAGKFHYRRQKSLLLFFKRNTSYIIVFLFATLATIYLGIKLSYLFKWMLIASLLTFIYSTPLWNESAKAIAARTGFFKTILLSLTWAFVTVIFPAMELLQTGRTFIVILLFVTRFALMLMLCLIFDMRDIQVDKMHGLHSLATDVSRFWVKVIMTTAFSIYVLAGVLVRFSLADNKQLVAHLATGLIVWIVYRMSLKKQGYLFYYFLVDGLMLIAALATFVALNV